ncbi:MAG: DUF5615 family PIN-like protein [Vicinamibacterales bacterium]|nr:DUF5615 family PIN-like protein [Vicinamibacterales bacterium]
MGTLASELAGHMDEQPDAPRVYVDANVPAPLVSYMRQHLGWDVLHVVEEDDLRRASDLEHFRLARQLRRTLITLDHDFLDDRRFPQAESGGVLLLTAPDESSYRKILKRLNAEFFRTGNPSGVVPLPFDGCKRHLHVDWLQGAARLS